MSHPLVDSDDIVKGIGNLAIHAGKVTWQPDGKVTGAHLLQNLEQLPAFELGRSGFWL
ncbi:MAG: hypothetical protein ACT4OZ_01380 [Gemmatimonadota bacterium]